MNVDYLRIDPLMDEHPDIEAAGFDGARVFEAVLRACARNDGRGKLRGKFAHPGWLAKRINLTKEVIGGLDPDTWVNHGIERCVRCGLLQREGQDLVIPGWEKFYSPSKTNSERQSEWRRRNRRETQTAAQAAVTDVTTPVTSRYGVTAVTTPVTSNATPHHTTTLKEDHVEQSSTVLPLPQKEKRHDPRVVEVFEHWKRVMGHPKALLDTKREKAVIARLREGKTVGDLKQAVDGCSKTPHNIGHNANQQRYDDLELICRSVSQVERFQLSAQDPPKKFLDEFDLRKPGDPDPYTQEIYK